MRWVGGRGGKLFCFLTLQRWILPQRRFRRILPVLRARVRLRRGGMKINRTCPARLGLVQRTSFVAWAGSSKQRCMIRHGFDHPPPHTREYLAAMPGSKAATTISGVFRVISVTSLLLPAPKINAGALHNAAGVCGWRRRVS